MRVLVARAGALGDVVLLGPALWDLREAGCRVELLAPARLAAPLLASGLVDGVLDLESADLAHLLTDQPSAAWEQRLAACQAAVLFSRSHELEQALTRRVPRVVTRAPRPPEGTHAAEWYRSPLAQLHLRRVELLPPWPTAPLAPATDRLLDRLGGPGFVSAHPGSGSPRKNWAAERFVAVARGLSAGRPWLHVRGPAEAAHRTPEGALPAHDLPLDQLAALLARTGLHLGNDAGVSHLAAAVGAPTVCLFGPTDASCWAPLGPRVRVVLAPQGNLERLGVETVAAAARALRSEALAPPCG